MTKILYVEDDLEIGRIVKEDLEQRGYSVEWLTSGEGAEQWIDQVELVILDVMLPQLDGFTVGQRLKNKQPHVPILMLSARTAVDDKLQGLQFADDYVTKPFHPDELAARIEVLLRRIQPTSSKELQIGHLTVNFTENRIVTEDDEEILLTAKQLQILHYLLRHPNQILTKEQLFEGVWGEPYIDGDKTLMVHIRHLREKIEKNPSEPTILETIRGIGYRVKQ